MEFRTIGDLARSLQFQRISAQQKSAVERLSVELARGTVSDPLRVPGTTAGRLSATEHRLSQISALRGTLAETATRLETQRLSLARLDQAAASAGPALLSAGSLGNAAMVRAAADSAHQALAVAVSSLNTTVAGQAIFAGNRPAGPAVISAQDMLSAVEAAVAGLSDPEDIATAVADWFAPGGDFDAVAWLGVSPGSGLRLGPGENDLSAPPPDAADPRLRDTLAGLAQAALLTRPLPLDAAAQQALALSAGARLQAAAESRLDAGASLGRLEADVAAAASRLAAEASVLEIERAEMTGADPYATASALEEARGQLDRVYLLTARLSRLSLAEYLR